MAAEQRAPRQQTWFCRTSFFSGPVDTFPFVSLFFAARPGRVLVDGIFFWKKEVVHHCCLLPSNQHRLPSKRRGFPPTVVGYPPNAVGYPSTAAGCSATAVQLCA